MARPNYTEQDLTRLTNQYQADAYIYASALMRELAKVEMAAIDGSIERNEEYLKRTDNLKSYIYLTVQSAQDARTHIAQGYPTTFSRRNIGAMSDRLMQDPVYANTMRAQEMPTLNDPFDLRNAQHEFRERVDEALGDNYQPQTIEADALPDNDRARRTVVLRQVLKELEATGNGYYVGGIFRSISRGSNSREFENVKTEVRRQLAMLEGNMPLGAADDDKMMRVLDAYSDRKKSTRTRGFGATRQNNVLKLYAEYTQHPAPRPRNNAPLHTPQEIETQYNEARRLDDLDVNRDEYVSFAREEYTQMPGRTVRQEYDDCVQTLRELTNRRRANLASNTPLTIAQQRTYRENALRAVALQQIMVRDPAGQNARVDEDQIRGIMQSASGTEYVNDALNAAIDNYDRMRELTNAFAINRSYNPAMSADYRKNPDTYRNPLTRSIETISHPTVLDLLRRSKNELRNLNFDGQGLTQEQAEALRPAALKVMAMQKMYAQSQQNGTEHVSPEDELAAIQDAENHSEIQRAVDIALSDPAKALELMELLSGDQAYDDVVEQVNQLSRGGIRNMVDMEATRISELPDRDYTPEEQTQAENEFIRFAALANVRDAHRDDFEPNPYVDEEEIEEAENALRQDKVFMDSVQGKIRNTRELQAAAQNLATVRYETHRAQAMEFIRRMEADPESADVNKTYLENEIAAMTTIRHLQIAAGSDNALLTDQQENEELENVYLGDAQLAVVRGIEQDGAVLGRELMSNTFSKNGDEFVQAYAQNVVPLRNKYPYPAFQPGTIGAAYDQIKGFFNPQSSNDNLAASENGRRQLSDHVATAIALRQLTLESPNGATDRLNQNRLQQRITQIKNDPRYKETLEGIKNSASSATQAMKALRNGPDLNALRARYNRARGNEFTDPAVGSLARLTAQQWADREMAALTAAYESGRRLTPQQKQRLIWSYARMHAMMERNAKLPGRAEERLTLNVANGQADEYLKRPGVQEKMDQLFADPRKTLEYTIRNRRREIWMDVTLSDADRAAKLMALGSLEKQTFANALITSEELAAEEQKIRNSVSFGLINEYLQSGGDITAIEPNIEVNYFDAMETRAFSLPGVQPGYENHRKILARQVRELQQQGRAEEMDRALAELFLIAQYQQDGIPYDKLPTRGEISRRAGYLAATDDLKSAGSGLRANPDDLDLLLEGAQTGMTAADMAQMLDGSAAEARLNSGEADLREPNVLHEVRARVMADLYTPLLEGNAEETWATEAQKLKLRDDYLRFTAANRIYAENPGRAFISAEELNAGVEALKNDEKFMEQMNKCLATPIDLRLAVFNSAGIQRWSDTEKLKEYRGELQSAKEAEANGQQELRGFVYGMVANQLAATIERRLSGREISNENVPSRDLNMAINEVQFSERYRAIENAIQADASQFDRLSNLFKLPPQEFKAAYEELTDEFIRNYPSVPMKDTNTIGHRYNMALEGVRAAAQKDPAAIANDEAMRNALAANIKEMFLDRRIVLNAPLDPQLMKRSVSIYDNPGSRHVSRIREQVEEGVGNFLGDLNERLKDPQVVAGYVNALKDAGDLRVLADQEYHSKGIFTDPLVQKMHEANLVPQQTDPQAVVQNAAAQARIAPEGETAEQREQRLQGQIATVLNKALLKNIPADEMPNSQQQAAQEKFIRELPDFQLAVKKMADDPQALESFLAAADSGASGADLAKLLDQNAIAQGKINKPESDPASNILFYLRKNTMQPHRDGIYLNTTGAGMSKWKRAQREVAIDHCVRATAVNKLLYENPDRVYFTDAEIHAQYNKVLEDKEYMAMLERHATSGLKLRGEFFGYQGVMSWDQMKSSVEDVDNMVAEPKKYKSKFIGAIYAVVDMMEPKRNGKMTNNQDASSAERGAATTAYMQTEEYKMLEKAFLKKPELLKHYILDVFTASDAEYEQKHKDFVEKIRVMEKGGAQAQQEEPKQPELEEEGELEFEIDGQKFDIKGEGENAHLEPQEAPKPQEEPQEEPVPREEPAEREPVGWPVFEADDKPLPMAGDPGSAFNQMRAELNEVLKKPVVDPGQLREGFGTLYITAVLEKAGKPVTEETIEACRGHLAEDKVFQKYMTKCLSDREFAKAQLNDAFFKPDPNAMREMMKTAINQPVQEKQYAPDTPMAQFKENLQKLVAGEKARHNAPLDKNHINRLAMQVCKTVALYNLSQSPKYRDKPVDYEDMKAEALRLKDDPEMRQSIMAAAKNPDVHKALVEGMTLSQNDPQTFANFVQGLGAAPEDAREWLDATYGQAKPAVQAQAPAKEKEEQKGGPQAGPVPQA